VGKPCRGDETAAGAAGTSRAQDQGADRHQGAEAGQGGAVERKTAGGTEEAPAPGHR